MHCGSYESHTYVQYSRTMMSMLFLCWSMWYPCSCQGSKNQNYSNSLLSPSSSSLSLSKISRHNQNRISPTLRLFVSNLKSTSDFHGAPALLTHQNIDSVWIRGGATESSTKKKKGKISTGKKKKRKQKKLSMTSISNNDDVDIEDGRTQMDRAIRSNQDIAKSLGDAIRDRKDILQNEPILPPPTDPKMDDIDASIISLGFSLGTSDPSTNSRMNFSSDISKSNNSHKRYDNDHEDHLMDGGGVEASRTSILANYFVQSHGGAYAFQCIVSAFSVLTGLAAILLPFFVPISSNMFQTYQITMIRRCLTSALLKHASGLFAAAILSAQRIPHIGLYETRKRIKVLARDPVAQYLFYCALLLVWLPSPNPTSTKTNISPPTIEYPWYLQHSNMIQRSSLFAFLGPILLREIIHLAWVVYDVCIIVGASASSIISNAIKIVEGGLDVFMSILLTPSVWKNADSQKKQRLLAKMVSRVSLFLEIGTGGFIGLDLVTVFGDALFSPPNTANVEINHKTKATILRDLLKKIVCARLYLNYMLVRKKKIVDLISAATPGNDTNVSKKDRTKDI